MRRGRPLVADELDGYARAVASAERDSMMTRIESLDRLTAERFVTLRTMLDSNAEKAALALASADKAITKSETATEKRFESVNEFRQALNDARTTAAAAAAHYITREQLDDRLAGMAREAAIRDQAADQRLSSLEKSSANLAGRLAVAGAVVTFVLSLVVVAANVLLR